MTSVFWTHLTKDLRIEWRSLDAIVSMLFFCGAGGGAVLAWRLIRAARFRSRLRAACCA